GRVAVLVDVDRDGRAALQLGPARVAGRQRLLAVLDVELRQVVERLVERPRLVYVDLQRHAGHALDGTDALDVEPVACAELQLQPAVAARDLLRASGHVVGVAEPDRPRGRRPEARQTEQAPYRLTGQLALQAVKR